MEGINWIELLPTIIPLVIAVILAVVALVLKLKKDEMKGLGKEVSELMLKIVDAAKDRHFSQEEILDIIQEAQDVVNEAKKLLNRE